MSILGVNGALAGAYQYANRTQRTGTNKTGFAEQLQKTGKAADTSKVDAYIGEGCYNATEGISQLVQCQ